MKRLMNGILAVALGFCFGCASKVKDFDSASDPSPGKTAKKEVKNVYDIAGVVVKIENHPMGSLSSGGTDNTIYHVEYKLDGDKGIEPKKYIIPLNTTEKGESRFKVGDKVEVTGWLSSAADICDMTGVVVEIEKHPVTDSSPSGTRAVTYHVEYELYGAGLPGTDDKGSEPKKYIMPIPYYGLEQIYKVGDKVRITGRIAEPQPVVVPQVKKTEAREDCLLPIPMTEPKEPYPAFHN